MKNLKDVRGHLAMKSGTFLTVNVFVGTCWKCSKGVAAPCRLFITWSSAHFSTLPFVSSTYPRRWACPVNVESLYEISTEFTGFARLSEVKSENFLQDGHFQTTSLFSCLLPSLLSIGSVTCLLLLRKHMEGVSICQIQQQTPLA